MKTWYTVKAMRVRDTHLNEPETVEFDFFGDVDNDYDLVMEIAKNKLHTTESVCFKIKEM